MIAMRKMLGLLVLVAACVNSDPPSGTYRLTWTATGDGCGQGTMADALDVSEGVLTFRWTGPGVPAGARIVVTGTVSGACVNVPADDEWQAYEVCADGDGIDADMRNVAGTCGRHMSGTR